DVIADLTPTDRMWLKSLQQSPDKLAIDGMALDNATIAQYMKDLAESPFFAAANLGSTQLTQIGGKKLKSFTLTLTIQNPEPVEPEEQPQTGTKK
ncbi:MAG: PilN domain-containing protein, partial [Desulfobulbaceae bacterium]|nr:PilN domain-containing protein [Desulfobulbaceae bacterium]